MVIRTLRWASMVSVCILLMLPGPASRPSLADATWYVSPAGSDSNTCLSPAAPCASINGALAKAGFAPGDTIRVAVGTYTGEGEAVVILDKNVALSGGWDAAFATQGGASIIDGQQSYITGLRVNEGVAATVERLVVRNAGAWGISVSHGTLVLHDSVLTNNGPGAIMNSGTLIVERCTLDANTGYGIHNDGGTVILTQTRVSDNGCAINNWGSMTLNDCTITGSTGSACYSSEPSAISNRGAMSLNNSTVIDNRVVGILAQGGRANVNNSTVTGNVGGLQSSGDAEVTLSNCTVTDNRTSNIGGGIYVEGGTVTLRNTIVAGNDARERPNCVGAIGSAGYNLIGDTSGCGYTPGQGDLTDVDPRLGALIGAPGRARYYPLLEGSPAIDAGDPQGCLGSDGPLTTDQRGAPRAGRCDIGAYEVVTPGAPATIYPHSGTPQHAAPGTAYVLPLQTTVLDDLGSPVSDAAVSFSAPQSGASATFADTGTRTTIVRTAETGIASTAALTADALAVNAATGAFTVTATVGDVTTPAAFALGNMAWYVAPGGSDGNPCTSPDAACATINGALAKPGIGLVTGDAVLATVGTYTDTGDQVATINKSVTIDGGWNPAFTARSGTSTIDAQGARGSVRVESGVTARIRRFTIRNGIDRGVYNGGTLVIESSAVISTSVCHVCCVLNEGTLILEGSTVSGNGCTGIHTASGSPLILNRSSVTGNRCSISGQGGGIVANSKLILNNSTVSGNDGNPGGIQSWSEVVLNSSTVSANRTVGIGASSVTMKNSIVAGNTYGSDYDIWADTTSVGHNIIGRTAGGLVISPTTDFIDMDPRLFPPMGSPAYQPLLRGSPAIDAGNPAGCTDDEGSILATDERGVPRLGRCDIGAYEYDPRYDPLLYLGLPMALRGAP